MTLIERLNGLCERHHGVRLTTPFVLWTSNSWRRFAGVCEPIIQSDGHPDLHFPNGGPEGPDATLLQDAPVLLAAIREAAAEIASLTADKEQALFALGKEQEHVAKLTAEVERLRANDWRYRFLRDVDPDAELPTVGLHVMNDWGNWRWQHVTGDELDSAIDAAIKEAGDG